MEGSKTHYENNTHQFFSAGLTIRHVRAQMGTPRKTLLKDAEEAADLVLLSQPRNATPERLFGWHKGRSERLALALPPPLGPHG